MDLEKAYDRVGVSVVEVVVVAVVVVVMLVVFCSSGSIVVIYAFMLHTFCLLSCWYSFFLLSLELRDADNVNLVACFGRQLINSFYLLER